MVTEFYRMLNSFHNSATEEGFLNRLATFLNNRKYLKLEIRDFSGLSPNNRKIAEMVLKLVNDPQDSTIQWRIVIAQLIQRIQDHMVNDFALNFHALISERIRDSGIISALEIANRIDEISERQTYVMEMLKISLKASLTIKLDTLNKEIIADFEKQIKSIFYNKFFVGESMNFSSIFNIYSSFDLQFWFMFAVEVIIYSICLCVCDFLNSLLDFALYF